MTSYKTNRCKAVLAMNAYAILSIFFIISNKKAVNEEKVNALDLILIVNAWTMCITFFVIIFTPSLSFVVPAGTRTMFYIRAFEGWLLIVVYIIGNRLVPVTVQQALTNTTPFWAALIGYCFASEKISRFEGISMLMSFGGVILITLAQT